MRGMVNVLMMNVNVFGFSQGRRALGFWTSEKLEDH